MSNRPSRPIVSPRARRAVYTRLLASLLQQVFALAVCVGFPAFCTAIAPVSWVAFQRHEGRVAASVQTCLLFIVPFKTQTIEPVMTIDDRFITGTEATEYR